MKPKQTSPKSNEQSISSLLRDRRTGLALSAVAIPTLLVASYDAGQRMRAQEIAEMNNEHVRARAGVTWSALHEAEQKAQEITVKKRIAGQKVGVYVLRGEVKKNNMIVKDPLILASEDVPAPAPSLVDEERVTVFGAVKVRADGEVTIQVLGDQQELDGVMVYTDGKDVLGTHQYVEATLSKEGLRVPSEPEITPGLILTDKQ